MASKKENGSVSSEQFSYEFLTCSLCLDRYKAPKVLPCQHTFCLQCLKNYIAVLGPNTISLSCPVCKEVTLIPQKDPACFRNNHHINCLLEYVDEQKAKVASSEEMQPSSSTSCTTTTPHNFKGMCYACGESDSLTSFCVDCNLWLCNICSKAHERVPATASHCLRTMDMVDKECKEMAVMGEKTVHQYKVANDENCEILQKMLSNLPEMIREAKGKIEKATEVACQVVQEKRKDILCKLNQFNCEQNETLSGKLDVINARNRDLIKIQDLLTAVKITDDGYSNQEAVKKIDCQLRTVTPLDEIPQSIGDSLSVHFAPHKPHLTDLGHMDIGTLVFTKGNYSIPRLLRDHQLKPVKGVSLPNREYISGLAVNKFADKFVVSNNEHVYVFKPDSSSPKRFLSPQSNHILNKPWGIAFSEADQEVYITESGEHEGKGAVTVFTLDGKVKSVFAAGLTLPRGIATHNGFVFVCDQVDKCVYIFNKWGKIHKVLKKSLDGKFLFVSPMFVSVGVNGHFAVSDNFNCVKIFDRHCHLLYEYWSSFPESQLWDVLVLRDGTTVVCDWKHGLHQISHDFQTTGLIAVEDNSLREPSAIASIENGTIFYVGSCNGDIYHVI